jgi:hypothetical protein
MGLFKKLLGGDAGIDEAMYETYAKLKAFHPQLEEHEILSLVLHYRFRKWPPEITLLIAVLFPRIDILTEWVIGLENSGGPRHLDQYLASTSTTEDRERALNYIQKKAKSKMSERFRRSKESGRSGMTVLEDIVDISAKVLWDKFHNRLNHSFDEDSKPLADLSDELRNTVANIYYRYFQFCKENQAYCSDNERKMEEIAEQVENQIESWESFFEATATLSLAAFPNRIVADYAAINHALGWLAERRDQLLHDGGIRFPDDFLIAIFKYGIRDAFSRTGASLVAECKMREGKADEIPNLMYYFEYSWGRHFDNPYKEED